MVLAWDRRRHGAMGLRGPCLRRGAAGSMFGQQAGRGLWVVELFRQSANHLFDSKTQEVGEALEELLGDFE